MLDRTNRIKIFNLTDEYLITIYDRYISLFNKLKSTIMEK